MTRRLRRPAVAIAALAATVVVAGCVNLPTNGRAQQGASPPNSGGLAQQIGVELDPIPPGPTFQPNEIVIGFLAASGSDKRIAKEYLTPAFAKAWQPSAKARIIDSTPQVKTFQGSSHVTGGHSPDEVILRTDHLATLVSAGSNEPGRLSVAPGGPFTFRFVLTQNSRGNWRINSIEDQLHHKRNDLLLLTEDDFQRDYLARDLYFPADASAGDLVPSPVYISATAGQLGVQQLVNGLTAAEPAKLNWLWRSVTTAFPRGTHLSADVQGSLAVVTLHGATGKIYGNRLHQMEAQLVWTLTQSPYAGGTGIVSVQLQYNRQLSPVLVLHGFKSWEPPVAQGPLYYQTVSPFGAPGLAEVTRVGSGHASKSGTRSSEPLPAGLGQGAFTAMAISPAQPGLTTTFAGCRGKQVYVAPLQPFSIGKVLLKTTLTSTCTSLSWDNKRELWVSAGTDIFVITESPTGLHVILVTSPSLSGDTFSSLMVSPDGVRAALIVKSGHRSSVYVAAISRKRISDKLSFTYLGQSGPALTVGPDLVNPTALTWWNGDHLLVIGTDGNPGAEPRLYNVPLDGGTSTAVPVPPGTDSVAANGTVAVVGTMGPKNDSDVRVLYSRDLDGIWSQFGSGTLVTYPG